MDFRYDFGGYRAKSKETPEAAIAYPENYVRSLHMERGLEIAEPIHYGSWPGRRGFLSYQDVAVAVKRVAA